MEARRRKLGPAPAEVRRFKSGMKHGSRMHTRLTAITFPARPYIGREASSTKKDTFRMEVCL
jgi:hypothetical protein